MVTLILIIVGILLLYIIIVIVYNNTIASRFNGNINCIFLRKYRIKRTLYNGVLNYTFQIRRFLLWRGLVLPMARHINPNISKNVEIIYDTYDTTSDLDIIDKYRHLNELGIIKYKGHRILRTIDNIFVNLDKYEYKSSSSRYIKDYKVYEYSEDLDKLKSKIDERIDKDLLNSVRYIYPE